MKIAVFGSAFNPPTLGHKDAIQQCVAKGVDEVWLIPSYNHAFGKSMGCYSSRCSFVDAFAQDLIEEGIPVKSMSVEHKIQQDGKPVYSYDLMEFLSIEFSEYDFVLALGMDNIDSLSKFYKGNEIIEKWGVLELDDRVPIRSTLVRDKYKNNENITDLVTPNIKNLILNGNQTKYW